MITDALKQSILNILSENFTGGTAPEDVMKLATLQQTLVLGADPLMKCPDDIRNGPILKLISRLQTDRVLAPRTYTRLHEAVEKFFSVQVPPTVPAESKPLQNRKAPPPRDALAEIRISETRKIVIPMRLVKAIGARKTAHLAVAAVLTEGARSVGGLIEMSQRGDLAASERVIRQALRSFAELSTTGLDGFIFVQESGQCYFKLEAAPR